MSLRNVLAALFVLLLASACGGGPVKRVSAPTASIQELAVQPDGHWRLRLRLQNFSNVAMTFNRLTATLTVTGREIGRIDEALDLDIAPESADVFEVRLMPAAGSTLVAADFGYELKGRITSREPKGDFPFERSSRLSPVPGLAYTWR